MSIWTRYELTRSLWKIFPGFKIKDPNGDDVPCGPDARAYSFGLYSIYHRYGDGNSNGAALTFSSLIGAPLWHGQKAMYTAQYIANLVTPWQKSFIGEYFTPEMFAYLCAMDDATPMYLPDGLKLYGNELAKFGGKEMEYQVNYLI